MGRTCGRSATAKADSSDKLVERVVRSGTEAVMIVDGKLSATRSRSEAKFGCETAHKPANSPRKGRSAQCRT